MMNSLGTTLESHSRIDRRDQKIRMGPEELYSRERCTSKPMMFEHLVTPLVAHDVTMNDGMVQVEPQKGIRTNAESASLKNLQNTRGPEALGSCR